MGKIVVSYGWTKINPLIYKGFLVRETGLEPASTYVHMNLNHARLPIPPFPHGQFVIARYIIAQEEGNVKQKKQKIQEKMKKHFRVELNSVSAELIMWLCLLETLFLRTQ